MSVLITIGVLVLIAVWAIGSYNRFVGLRNQVTKGWKQIDVQLKRRHDLVPNLVNAVRGAIDFERGTLEAVVTVRNRALANSGPADASRKEGERRACGQHGVTPRRAASTLALGGCQAPLAYSRLQAGQLAQWGSQDSVDTLAPRHCDGGR